MFSSKDVMDQQNPGVPWNSDNSVCVCGWDGKI